ncbi:hypothetical protein CDD83_2310 [Cordyceps sp. RAO-2017]|nr:hypothetical protein CDD83_2310 [Cordyceps sp. RAO-2017]
MLPRTIGALARPAAAASASASTAAAAAAYRAPTAAALLPNLCQGRSHARAFASESGDGPERQAEQKPTSPRPKKKQAKKAKNPTSSPSQPVNYFPPGAPHVEYATESLGGPVGLSWTPTALYVACGKGRRRLEAVLLRDSCTCAACRDPSSGNKKYSVTELGDGLALEAVQPREDGLLLTFGNDIPRLAGVADESGGAAKHETLMPGRRG